MKPIKQFILLTGATGYVGGRLLKALEARGYRVRCLARRPEFLKPRVNADTEIVQGDLLDPASLQAAMQSVHTAYYMVHSMGSTGAFEEQDRRAAQNFAEAARQAGVRRIVYLGGLGRGDELSPHLSSRHEVGRILRESGVSAVELRASIIIGSGSLSFEMIRALVEKLPIMVTPRWTRSLAQPIAIEDVIAYLIAAMEARPEVQGIFEIGGAEQVSYLGIMQEYARQRGLKRWIIPVPVLTPRLSSLWLGLVTPLFARVGKKLIDSVRHDTVVTDGRAREIFKLRPRGIHAAIARALNNEDQEFSQTRWSDALSSLGNLPSWGGVKFGTRIVDSRSVRVACSAEVAMQPIRRLGGKTGWYYGNWLWRLRGFIDLLFGGVGMRRGRCDPEWPTPGDPIDFWRVEAFEPERLLRLFAEMKYFILLVVMLFSFEAFGQKTGKIQGRVIDAKTQEPLLGVNVVVMDTPRGDATDEEGRYSIEDLPPGTYRLRFSYISYEPVIKTDVVVETARPAVVNAEMLAGVIEKEEIVVTAGYFAEEFESPTSIATLSREEIRRFPGGFEDVVRTVSTLPGVAVVNEGGRNDLLVRGGGPSENLYLIDNIEVPNINHFGTQGTNSGALSFINLDFVDEVEFSTGGFGARYGDKMSSVLSLDMRPGRKDRFGGEATISATQFGLELEGPLSKQGGFIFSARQSYLDLIFRAAGQPFIPVYTDFNFFANHEFSSKQKLSLLALAAFDRVDRDQSTLENRVTNAGILDNTQNQFITGANFRQLFAKGFLDVTLNANYNQFRLSQADAFGKEYYNSKADEGEINFKLTSYYSLTRSGGLYSGFSAKAVLNDNTTAFADTIYDRNGQRVPPSSLGLPQQIVADTSAQKIAAYLEWEQDLSDQLYFNFGVRGDYYGFIQEAFYPSARLALGFKAYDDFRIKASLGRYHQSPSYVWVVNPVNRNLKALRNDMAILGLEYLLREDLNSSLEVYYKRYRDLPTGTIPDQTDYLVQTNTGVGYGGRDDDFQSFGYSPLVSAAKGWAYGFELLLQKRFSGIPCYGQISFAYNKSEFTAGNGKTYPGQFDQRFIFNLSGGYVFNSKWEFSSKFRYYTGAPYTPVYLPAENNGLIQNLPEEYLSRRLQAGHHLDVRVDRRFNFANWTMILFLDIQNIYNFKAQRRPSYDFWENKIDDRNAIGLLPSIGISAEF